ncbi:MAG: hypothetical protein JEY94_08810 [Melioribacteraceae bacterium]|nr:hypothetical protein [Melioribacteraceae bacterium]
MKKFILILLFFTISISAQDSSIITKECSVFSFKDSLTLPGSTMEIFDAVTGDISEWWDHSFYENPYKLYIEPKAGGGFYEVFNKEGDGALHATVIYSDRGKQIRFDGPLGLSGKALQLVCTYNFYAMENDSTKLVLSVNGSGEIDKGIPAIIKNVWFHFLHEQFEPYILAGKHKK